MVSQRRDKLQGIRKGRGKSGVSKRQAGKTRQTEKMCHWRDWIKARVTLGLGGFRQQGNPKGGGEESQLQH